jgi:hypothetical protein
MNMELHLVLERARILALQRLKSQANPLDDAKIDQIFGRFSKGFAYICCGPVTLDRWWSKFGPEERFDVAHPEKAPRRLIYSKTQLEPLPMAPAMLRTHGYVASSRDIFERDALNAFWNAALDLLCERVESASIAA